MLLEFSVKRLQAFLTEIRRLQTSDFPYPHSRLALEELEKKFAAHLNRMEQLANAPNPADADTVRAACTSALNGILHYLPLLGFLLRSTNVRNGFEVYAPLFSLSRKLLGDAVKLVISSEWDYSPFTYTSIPDLPGFVLIGFPAPESENPLLVPLAGHELGHSIWSHKKLRSKYLMMTEKAVLDEIHKKWEEYTTLFPSVEKAKLKSDMFARETWSLAHDWAIRQAEETFCDYCGVAIFRESFLYAFAYLVAPSLGASRSCRYPGLKRRISNLLSAAKAMSVPEANGYADLFEDDPKVDLGTQDKFLLSLADSASQSLDPKLIDEVNSHVVNAIAPHNPVGDKKAITNAFKTLIPAQNTGGIVGVLNVAWSLYLDKELWRNVPQVKDRDLFLKELVLKSFEVSEIEELLSTPNDPKNG